MVWTVAVIAAAFGLLPILGQRLLTDNRRCEAKRRADQLGKPGPFARAVRGAGMTAGGTVTIRTLKAGAAGAMIQAIAVFMAAAASIRRCGTPSRDAP
jgi:hypothetical protein